MVVMPNSTAMSSKPDTLCRRKPRKRFKRLKTNEIIAFNRSPTDWNMIKFRGLEKTKHFKSPRTSSILTRQQRYRPYKRSFRPLKDRMSSSNIFWKKTYLSSVWYVHNLKKKLEFRRKFASKKKNSTHRSVSQLKLKNKMHQEKSTVSLFPYGYVDFQRLLW